MQKIRKYSYLIFHRTWNILGSFGQNPERDFYKKNWALSLFKSDDTLNLSKKLGNS